ncbi:MAG: DUF2235 domain-containing protein [Magnetococcales bacterium]|nr:DUF2235 domain-containing protein [Magnetococcales bacterium]
MPKKIIFCFDGTSNDPHDAKQKSTLKMEMKDSSISNVYKLHLLLGGGVTKGECHIDDQQSFYYSGVGTYGNRLLQWFNAGLALPNMDVGRIINRAVDDLYDHYEEGDTLFVFGFSRGAAIARRFCSIINDRRQKRAPNTPPVRIRFLGVFDTVASIGLPNLHDDRKPVSDVQFENCTLSPWVDEALHMVSLDDKRTAFMPTLIAYDPQRVTEIWFAGAHSDIGGSYRYDGLADITLNFLLDELSHRKLGLNHRMPKDIDFSGDDCKTLGLAFDDLAIHPNPLGKSHQQERSWLMEWTLTDRDCRVHFEEKPLPAPLPVPLVHYSVIERIHGDPDYRPISLSRSTLNGQLTNQLPHRVWRPDGMARATVIKGLEEHLVKGPPTPIKLAVNESRLVTIYANQKMNRSYVYANRNNHEAYDFQIDRDQIWFDSGIHCGPDGWDRDSEDFPWYQDMAIKWMEDERRCPPAKWFEVVGVIGKKEQEPFRVLSHTRGKANLQITQHSGEIFLFANDMEDRYDNNLGSIQVIITRTQ